LLLSNEIAGDARNLSFEREFGKMIAYQDVMAALLPRRHNRVVRRVVQTPATAVFPPIQSGATGLERCAPVSQLEEQ
jgi:hypothetical protein